MSEPIFKSSLSMEEIEANFKDVDFFSGVMEGLEEALAVQKRKSICRDDCTQACLAHSEYQGNAAVFGMMTQRTFAEMLGVSRRTVEAWESGKSTPTPTAKKLMYLIQEDHSLVQKLQ